MKKRYIVLIITVLITIITSYPFLIKIIFPLLNLCKIQEYGQFGDMFGILNSLFSGFTLIILLITYFIEKKERIRQISPILVKIGIIFYTSVNYFGSYKNERGDDKILAGAFRTA